MSKSASKSKSKQKVSVKKPTKSNNSSKKPFDIKIGSSNLTRFEEARIIADVEAYFRVRLRTYSLNRWKLNEGSMSFTVNYSDQSVQIT